MQTLLEEYNKYHSMVTASFNEDPGFLQSLDKVIVNACLLVLVIVVLAMFKVLLINYDYVCSTWQDLWKASIWCSKVLAGGRLRMVAFFIEYEKLINISQFVLPK